jgi:GxxExxY protein
MTNGDKLFMTNSNKKILYKELSYKLQGLFYAIRNDLGSGHKESIYQKALEKELQAAGIAFQKEPAIKIYSAKNEYLGLYRPDFIIENKIIIELKAAQFVTKQEGARIYDYLRNSKYELAYLVNFASPRIYIKRLIFTNDRKNNP